MKKLTALLLIVISIACIFSGCGNDTSNKSASSEYNSSTVKNSTKDIAYPTFSESLEFIQKEFPEYKDSIVCLENLGNVVLQKNGIIVGVYYEDGTFDKIISQNSDFTSAFKVISDFYSEIIDYNLTATELETNMKLETQMPNWSSYTYEDNGLSYTITVGNNCVQIQVEGFPTNTQTNTDNNLSASSVTASNNNSQIIGGWDFSYAVDLSIEQRVEPEKPYVSFYRFNNDGTGNITIKMDESQSPIGMGIKDITWEFEKSDGEDFYYTFCINGNPNKGSLLYFDDTLATQKGNVICFYEKQSY